ncbi:MAG TPA: TIGR03118 family protein [Thermoanaerobaculia bacterium]|nr:TIGR03118 family protein [Thermoanaerobaculia bacterium]
MTKTRVVSFMTRGAAAALLALAAIPASAQRYIPHNLVSDEPGLAAFTDPNLVNAWGIASSGSGPIWIANNGSGTSTIYHGNGTPLPLVVTIPAGAANTEGAVPTGLVFNATGQFMVTENSVSGSAVFIFAGEDGTISGWNPSVDATHAILPASADLSASGAVFKGLALGSTGSGNFLYATDFHDGFVQVFDSTFTPTTTFTDSSLTALGFAPFGIANIGGNLYVSFAKQDADAHDDVAGAGNGYVDEFDTSGTLIRQFAAQGALNSPWGMVLAPGNFGAFAGAILVGNFGDGRINAFDPSTGDFLGQMLLPSGQPLVIDGLWGLRFGNGGSGGSTNLLFFTSGPDGESHGLFGSIRAIPAVAGVPAPARAAIVHGRR